MLDKGDVREAVDDDDVELLPPTIPSPNPDKLEAVALWVNPKRLPDPPADPDDCFANDADTPSSLF